MKTKLLAVLFVLCSSSVFAGQMHTYVLTDGNFENELTNIVNNTHLNAFFENTGGVGYGVVESYLKSLVFEGMYANIDMEAPIMCFPTLDKDFVSVEVTGEYDTYHFSYFRAEDGHNVPITSSSPEFDAPMVDVDVFFNLMTVYGTTSDGRSSVYVIIIEKDFFTCDKTHYQFEGGGDDGDRRGGKNLRMNQYQPTMEMAFNSYPNPVTRNAQLSFRLEQAAQLTLDILHPVTGEVIARKMENQYFLKGKHLFDFDLQSLPDGTYLLVLSTQHRSLSKLIVKAN